MKTIKDFRKRLLILRKQMNMTQRTLAQEFRVSPGAIALWESGSRRVSGPITKLIEIYEQNVVSSGNCDGNL